METNPRLKALIMQIVDNQLRGNDPPETRLTLDRLMREGCSKQEAKELIACVVTSEIYDVMKQDKPYDNDRFCAALARLPQLPWDDD